MSANLKSLEAAGEHTSSYTTNNSNQKTDERATTHDVGYKYQVKSISKGTVGDGCHQLWAE